MSDESVVRNRSCLAEPVRFIASPWWRADAFLLLAIVIASFLFARWYMPLYRTGGGVPVFYQEDFGPAVMLTCGRGFVNVAEDQAPALDAFLHQHVDRFQCRDIPATIAIKPLTGFQGVTRYLTMAGSLVWRVTGITWQSLDVLVGVFFAVTVAVAYATMRFISGRTVSLLISLLWAVSPRHLQNIPHLRDYSKAPFFVFMLLAMAVAFVEKRTSRLFALGVFFGLAQGVGLGMRTDVLMNFIPFFIILFVGRSGPLQNLKPKLACTVATVTVFVAVSFPVIHTYARNSSLFHIVLLGLAAPYDANLDIGLPRPAYEYLYAYDDSYLQAVIQSYANRTHQGGAPLILLTPAYDRVCQEYFTRLVETFPGDMMTRAAASVVRVINLPFWMPDGHVPTGVTNPTLVWLWERRASVLQAFLGTGGGLVAATLVVIGIAGLRFTLIGFVLLWFWAAYPVIEFQGRHIFQFEFLILAALALGSSVVWWSVVQPTLSRGAEAALTILPHVFRAAATVAVLFAAVGGALAIARLIQIPRARALLMSYIDAPADPIPLKIVPLHDGRARLVVDVFKAPSARNEVQEAMVEAEFNPGPCGRPSDIAATFRYEQADPLLGLDFSRETKLELRSGAPTRVFFPAYSFRRDGQTLSRFIGVDVPSAVSTCVRLSQMRDLDRFPLLLPATLTPDWQRRLYQRLRVDPIPVS